MMYCQYYLFARIRNSNCNDDFSDKYITVVVTSYFDSNFDKKKYLKIS